MSPASSPSFPPAPVPPASGLTWKQERRIVAVLLALFALLELNNINNLGFIGQDFPFHRDSTELVAAHPGQWFPQDATNRPLAYWIGALCKFATRGQYTCELGSVVLMLLVAGACWLLHDSSRDFIRSPLLRVAALVCLLFLPLTFVTAAVYAPDGLALLPFALAARGLIRCLTAENSRDARRGAVLAGAALVIGNFTKATFCFLPAAAFVLLILRQWRQRADLRQLVWIGGWTIVLPLAVSAGLLVLASRERAKLPSRHTFDWHGTGELTWKSLLGLKRSDARILQAPGYWDTVKVDGQDAYPLLASNSYSYPALLHLGIFTDVMNFTRQVDSIDGYHRTARAQVFSVWAVRLGVALSLAVLAALVLFWFATLRDLARLSAPSFALLAWNLLGLAWFCPLVVILPYVHHAYDWGYWLPRLTYPALVVFLLTFFAMLDRWLAGRPGAQRGMLAVFILQALLHLGELGGFSPAFVDNDLSRPHTVLSHVMEKFSR